jgi:uncharacterized protein YutE (UPF0331/DUF86 family)
MTGIERDQLHLRLIAEAVTDVQRRIVAFRNIMAHEYHRVDPHLVWEAVSALGEIEAVVDAEIVGPREEGQ